MRTRPGTARLSSAIALVAAALTVALSLTSTVLVPLAKAAPSARAANSAGPDIAAGAIRTGASHGLCLDNTQGRNPSPHKAVPLVLGTCGGPGIATWSQLWTVEADQTIRIDGLCLTRPTSPAARARLQPCSGSGPGQRWQVTSTQIRLAGTSNCLTLANSHPRPNAAVTVSRCNPAAPSQHWIAPAPGPVSRTLSVVSRLLEDYNYAGHGAGLFTSDTDAVTLTCSNVYRRGNCWWWSAIALYALTDFAEQAPSATITVDSIKAALAHTYATICGAACPSSPNPPWSGGGQGNLPVNFANRYYDDTGWWALTWANAYRLTGNPRYLYLAEELWSFLTRFAWSKSCGGALIQHEGKNRRGVSSTQDTTSNVLYLRLSAWLYTLAAPQNQSAAQKYLAGTGGRAAAPEPWPAGWPEAPASREPPPGHRRS